VISEIIKIFKLAHDLISVFLTNKKKIANAEADAKANALSNGSAPKTAYEIAQLSDKASDRYLRWAAFILFASPLLSAFISAPLSEQIQVAWATLLPWQATTLQLMCVATFGFKKLPQFFGSMIKAVKDALRD